MRPDNWINYEVSEEEWKQHWKEHFEIILQMQESGKARVNLIIYHTKYVFAGKFNYEEENHG